MRDAPAAVWSGTSAYARRRAGTSALSVRTRRKGDAMETRTFTITVHQPKTRVQRLRERRRKAAIRAAAVFAVVLGAAILLTLQLNRNAKAAKAGTGLRQTAQIIHLPLCREPETYPEPETAKSRYAEITEDERELIARVVYLEARGECAEGQQAVAEVILNRVAADNFPNSVSDVIYQGAGTRVPQFSTAVNIPVANPGEQQYAAVDAAVHGENILPMDVVYFSAEGENDRTWGTIGGHVFCRQYLWE